MTATVIDGQTTWDLTRDDEGHRNYKVVHMVEAGVLDGPAIVINASGLPAVGSIWSFDNDVDIWAYCTPAASVKPVKTKEPNKFWTVEQNFTTKPNSRCQDETFEDPLTEPQKVSGSFVKYTKEVYKDRNGALIQSSSHELFRGPQVEFDFNKATVSIEQNVNDLELELFSPMVDSVNDATLWGLTTRKIKLSNVSWSKNFYGTCSSYYTRKFDFDIDFNTFDRTVLDEGSKVLNGHWGTGAGTASAGWILDDIDGSPPDSTNPGHFIRFHDRTDEVARVILDGAGQPWDGVGALNTHDVEYYDQDNFLLLGIPTLL